MQIDNYVEKVFFCSHFLIEHMLIYLLESLYRRDSNMYSKFILSIIYNILA